MFAVIARIIGVVANLLILLVIVNTVLSYFLSPYHPLRASLDRFIGPLQAPIRRIVPPVGMFDFSPLILIVIIEILSFILTTVLYSL